MNIKLNSGLIIDEIRADEWVLGGETVDGEEIELGAILNPAGDWRDYVKGEAQSRYGLETMSCATYGTLNALEIMLRYLGKEETDYAERFTSTLAGTTKNGNSPHKVSETMRKKGVVVEEKLPFDNTILTWNQFYAPIPQSLLAEGKKFLKKYSYSHQWLWTGKNKYQRRLLIAGLQRSPVGVAVYGWNYDEKKKLYVRPTGVPVNHWCLLVGRDDDGAWVVLDSYEPFIKRLDPDYDFELPKVYSLGEPKQSWWQRFLNWLR